MAGYDQLIDNPATPLFESISRGVPHAIVTRSVFKPPLKSTREARSMLIARGAGDFLDTQVSIRQQLRCFLQSFFRQNLAEGRARCLLEKTLEM